jgi:hypothetical protein
VEDSPHPPWETPDASSRPEPDRPSQSPGHGPPPQPSQLPPPPAPPPGWGMPPPPPPGQAPGWGTPPQQGPGWGAPGDPHPGWGPGLLVRPKPGIIPLRPITLGEMYDGAFQAMRTNPRTMVGVSAVVIGISTLITLVPLTSALVSLNNLSQNANSTVTPSTRELVTLGVGLLGTFFAVMIQWLAVTVLTGLLIVAVSEAVLGRRIGPGELWRRARSRVWALIGLALLSAIVIGVCTLFFVVPGVIVYIGWSLAAPALLLENQSIGAALGRSWQLTRGSRWRVLGILVLTWIIVRVASLLVVGPVTLISTLINTGLSGSGNVALILEQVLQQIAGAAAGAVFYPFQAAVTALLYIDLRMRREGLDVELLRATEAPPG